jgi:hypothetical protein
MDVLMQIKSLQGVKTTQTSSRSLEDRGHDAIELTIFRFTSHDLCDDATCTTHRHSFASFEAKLKNPSLTCFTMKQAAGYRRMSSHCLYPLIGFEAQTDKPPLTWF